MEHLKKPQLGNEDTAIIAYDREALYQAAINQASEGVMFIDANSKRILETNPSLSQMLGYDNSELSQLTLFDLIAHDRETIDANTAQILMQGRNCIGERNYRRKDGSLIAVDVSGTALVQAQGIILCVILRELTGLKHALNIIRAKERQLREVVQNAPVIHFLLDMEGVITFADGQGLRSLNRHPDELIGQSILRVSRSVEVLENVRRALAGDSFSANVVVRGRVFSTHYAPLLNEQGTIGGVIGVATDISPQVQAESELRRRIFGLTAQERVILPYLTQQLSYQQIARTVGIKSTTVRKHVQNIGNKLGVSGIRASVVQAAQQEKLV